jgi:hypothetical protein
MKKSFVILVYFLLIVNIYAEQVEPSNRGISNAFPGDYIIRENGDKVILNQADIDYARNQLRLNVAAENQYIAKKSNEKHSGSGFSYFFVIIFIICIGVFLLIKNSFKVNYYQNKQGKTYIDENGYRRFSDSNKLVHRYVVEKKIGRKLRQGEIVHHINRNKLDNSSENLEVFANQEEHEKHHRETDWLFKLNRRISRRFRLKLW